MLRTIGGVVVGYGAKIVVVIALFRLAYSIMGPDRAFLPGTYTISSSWIMLTIVVGLLAAIIGGLVSALIGKGTKAPWILAVLVLVLGVIIAVFEMQGRPADLTEVIREHTVTSSEALQNRKQPTWIAFLNPVIGFTGVLAGARLRKS